MEKIEPTKCWCGCKADIHISAYSKKYHVSCAKTNNHIPWYDGFNMNGGFNDPEMAISDWNYKIQNLTYLLKQLGVKIWENEY